MLKSRKYGLVLFTTKLPYITITLPFRVPVTTREYLNWKNYIPEYYKGPNTEAQQKECYHHDSISKEVADIITFI